MVREDRTADATLTEVLPLMEPEVAEMVREPRARAAPNPPPWIDNIPLFDEVQVTEAVIFCVLWSEKVPVAVNCWRVPRSTSGFAGVMVIETRIALVTVRVPYPATPEKVALMVEEPMARLVAKPEPEMVTTLVLDEAQTTEAVRFLVDPSL
jgi:hypothetical protein